VGHGLDGGEIAVVHRFVGKPVEEPAHFLFIRRLDQPETNVLLVFELMDRNFFVRIDMEGFFEKDLIRIEQPLFLALFKEFLPVFRVGNVDQGLGRGDEIIEGVLNSDRTMATFEMPHFSIWYTFTGYRLVKEETWAPYELSGQSETCSEGACGTYVYAINFSSLVYDLYEYAYNVDIKVVDTRCIGPRYLYAQQLFSRCKVSNYKVYNYTGEFIEVLNSP